MQRFFSALMIGFVLTSCTFYEPEYRGGEKIHNVQLNGRSVSFIAGANVYNENSFAVKVKPSTLDLHVEGQYMGKIRIEKKVKMKGKTTTFIESPFTATLEDGALFKAVRFIGKDQIQIRLSGKVRAGVWIFGKKIDVNQTKTISSANFNDLVK